MVLRRVFGQKRKYMLNEIITGASIFCATGITTGDLVSGIQSENKEFISETLILRPF